MEILYYIMNRLYRHKVPVIPRLIMLLIRFLYGSFIPPQVTIGKNISFGHKMGIVLHRGAVIGDNVKIRHQVTFGSGHAVIGNDVHIGAGAKIIGSVRIGNRAKIGANAVVVKDIPDDAIAVGIPARVIKIADESTE